MTRRLLGVAVAAWLLPSPALAQGPTQLPPPPPPPSSPQYVAPSPPSASGTAPSRRDTPPSPRRREQPAAAETTSTRRSSPSDRGDDDEGAGARTGLQIGVRTGIAIPAGSVTGAGNDGMSSLFKPQLPLFLEVGAKVTPSIFLGGFASFSLGGAGGDFRDVNGCNATSSRSCSSTDFRIGAEIQYHFQPGDRMNPWIGFGIGYEAASASGSGTGPDASRTVTGFELFNLSGGVDFRLTHLFGVGPFVSIDAGEYAHSHVEVGGFTTSDASVDKTALHEWFTLGVRGVVFP